MCAMVHPDHRRKGIFTKLFHEILDSLKTRKTQKLYINAPPESECAKMTLQNLEQLMLILITKCAGAKRYSRA